MQVATRVQMVDIIPESEYVIDQYLSHLNEAFERFEVNTPLRQAAFIAQIGHESIRMTQIEENLNYSANGLLRTFPDYFTPESSKEFAYKPMRIANRVYANRGGNGPEDSGDGWRYRGRGLIRIHYQRAYMLASKRLTGKPNFFTDDPNLVFQPEWSVRTAFDFWEANELTPYADRNSAIEMRNMTRKINRGLRGLDDRLFLWRRAKDIFGAPPEEE